MTNLLQKRSAEIEKIRIKSAPGPKRSTGLPVLYIAQQEYGYGTPEAIREAAEIVGVSPTEVESVVGFYTLFYDKPIGRHVVQICNDMPCALRGSEPFLDHACKKLGLDKHQVEHGGQTTEDGSITLEAVMCLAACDKAPMMQVDLEYHENLTPEKFDQIVDELRKDAAV